MKDRFKLLPAVVVLTGLLLASTATPRMQAQDPPSGQAQGQIQSQPAGASQNDTQNDRQNQDPAQDPPGRVARLDYSTGSVSFQPGGEGDWVTAVENRPLTSGDNLWADQNSRAEAQIGSTSIRLNSETSLTFLDLDDRTTQLKLSQGTLILRVRHLDDGDSFEVDTPNLAFALQSPGEYRVDVNGNGDQTVLTVWQGRGEVTGGGSSYTVIAGQQATFSGADQLDHQIAQVPASDDFDNFAFDRDKREDHTDTANYISTETTGYEDLDENGSWSYEADYGPVWTPTVAVGWAPYRFGHWVFIEPWGWSWVEAEPWGFAPFHYGRWAFAGSRWCWLPGPVVVRPIYSPALVAFVGGGGFNFSFGAGVGWFPLGPREVFVPWYRTSRGYVNNLNITNTRVSVAQVANIYNSRSPADRVTYVNQHVGNGVTVVSQDTFVNARPVEGNLAHVDAREIASAPVMHQSPALPTRASVFGAGAPARVKPPDTVVNRRVVATRNPAPPRSSFEQRQAGNLRTETPRTLQPQPSRPAEPTARPEESPGARNVPRPPATIENGQAHPLVRPAPPVEERPEQQRQEQEKFQTWQRQRPAPASHPAARESTPPHEEKPRK
jgi:hypothetical protein